MKERKIRESFEKELPNDFLHLWHLDELLEHLDLQNLNLLDAFHVWTLEMWTTLYSRTSLDTRTAFSTGCFCSSSTAERDSTRHVDRPTPDDLRNLGHWHVNVSDDFLCV